jgi:hypothetical protein
VPLVGEDKQQSACLLSQGAISLPESIERHFAVNVENASGLWYLPRPAIAALGETASEVEGEPRFAETAWAEEKTLRS